jgi:hypothetical protein
LDESPIDSPEAESAEEQADELIAAELTEPESVYRRWTSADGKFTVEAEFVNYVADTVYLRRKDNGRELRVPLGQLSDADQTFIKQQLEPVQAQLVPEHDRRKALKRVRPLAISIIVLATLGLLASAIININAITNNLQRDGTVSDYSEARDDPAYQRGRALGFTVPLVAYLTSLFAAIGMLKLRNWGTSLAAVVLVTAPCSPVFILGLGVGVWGLFTLFNPEVRAPFAARQKQRCTEWQG